jgi:hypothetical protein
MLVKNINIIFLIALLSSLSSCTTSVGIANADCQFLHSVERQPVFNQQKPAVSVQLLDDKILIQGTEACVIESAGLPVDLVWLYPFHHNKLIYAEKSALGNKLNLVDINSCKSISQQNIPNSYTVGERTIWAQTENCGKNQQCPLETVFQLDQRCRIIHADTNTEASTALIDQL